MIRHLAVQAEAAKPPVSQMEMDLFAKPPFRRYAQSFPDHQHAHDQVWINPISCICNALPGMDDKKSQLDRFKEAARELEADDDEAKFNKKLGKLVRRSEKHPLGKLNSDSNDKGS